MDEYTIQKCIRLPTHLIEFIEEMCEGTNFSEKLRNFIESQTEQKSYLDKKILKHTTEIDRLKKQLKENLFYEETKLVKEETDWLVATVTLLKTEQGTQYFIPRFTAYKNLFHRRLTISDFKLLLKEVEYGSNK